MLYGAPEVPGQEKEPVQRVAHRMYIFSIVLLDPPPSPPLLPLYLTFCPQRRNFYGTVFVLPATYMYMCARKVSRYKI
jgi:hypothetical protein